jgi:hypothetical protein
MQPGAVVPGDVLDDRVPRAGPGGPGPQVEQLAFDRSEERFRESVIPGTGLCGRSTRPPGSRRPERRTVRRGAGRIQLVVATPRSGGVRMGRPRGWAAAATGRSPMRSPGRPPVARREDRQRFWAAVSRGLSSEDAGAASGVSPAVGVRWFRQGGGMRTVSRATPSGRLPVLHRAGGDRDPGGPRVRSPGDRTPGRPVAVDDLPGAAPKCGDPGLLHMPVGFQNSATGLDLGF